MSEVDPNLTRALYSLAGVIASNIVIGWGKNFYYKRLMFRQLRAEVLRACLEIKNNAKTIEPNSQSNDSFPLLSKLNLAIHYSKIGEILVDEKIGKMGRNFIGNCEHYNRIIELGEKDSNRAKRKTEVLHQGGLLHNDPVQIYEERAGVHLPYVGQTRKYLDELSNRIDRYKKFAKWFPWYFVIFWLEKNDSDEGDIT